MKNNGRFSFSYSDELEDKVQTLAKKEGLNPSSFIKMILNKQCIKITKRKKVKANAHKKH